MQIDGAGRSRGTAALMAAALATVALAAPALVATTARADDAEQATWARQGFMNLVWWEAGPLFAMAKGSIPYDAEDAKARAARLQGLYQYPYPSLFIPGTSKADRPGKTRALAEIWQDQARFEADFQAARAAVLALQDKVGEGQPALAAAVGELGKACGNCHNTFRAKDY